MAIGRKKNRKVRRIIKKTYDVCPFCKERKDPGYKEYQKLFPFLSERAKILGKARTGVCSRHQRKLSQAIKRARYLGLLSFTPRV
ncbi:30S ribosomal protein S18 [Candidatus Woesebacteria bacterium RBG_13_34_9]|uniref:Small ribosomal subunit protein bS18 n=1 Tax=Candidatus Woesebacteria bacterium RBG_13_34_9 TaxID=1802477 RepID=A0A1F7X2N4_9BACT|nr:MAG: 30S ribosomal protein S18 [Candidatus Woesebacteria bacterium RBG_13_34_9]